MAACLTMEEHAAVRERLVTTVERSRDYWTALRRIYGMHPPLFWARVGEPDPPKVLWEQRTEAGWAFDLGGNPWMPF